MKKFQKYKEKRMAQDPEFWEGYQKRFEAFKLGVLKSARRSDAMALDYYLTIQNIGNKIYPEQLRESLADTISFQINPISGILMKPGLSVSTFEDDDEKSAFGSPWPDLCVAFRIDKFGQHEKGLSGMLKALFWLTFHLDGDMIFSSDSEEVIFQRISGKLTLGDAPHFWAGSGVPPLNLPSRSLNQTYEVFKTS